MQTQTRRLLGPAGYFVAALANIVASPTVLVGQALSSRPASVALTVVVPGHAQFSDALSPGVDVTVVRRSVDAAEVETLVGVGERLTSRVEVRLGTEWRSDSARVWVRNSAGAFERLVAGTRVIAVDAPPFAAVSRAAVAFRIESDRPLPTVMVPVEYRLRVGSGELATVWSVESRVRLEAAP